MEDERPAAPASVLVTALALLAAVFWLHYCLVHDILGLLTVDEIYFAHMFWLMREGLEPYSDFYAMHLPAYFRILEPLIPPAPPADLSFVWSLRAVSALVIGVYVLLLLSVRRRDFLFLLPLLLLFISFARMVEIRPDTFGLLLFNIGLWYLLRGTERKNILLAAAFSGLALFFSARAAVMIVGMGLLCAYLCARRKDARTFGYLVLLAIGFAAIVLSTYVLDPERFLLVLTSVYLDPISVTPDLSLAQRVLALDRFILLVLILLGLAGAYFATRRDESRNAGMVVGAACATQLALIAIDPSPFQYVYGWSLLPTLAGIALLGRHSVRELHSGLALAGAASAIALLSVSVASSIASGQAPRPGSILRISYDPPFAVGELRRSTTPDLLARMVSTQGQQGLWNQLALLTEICTRFRGPVLAKLYAHPICMHDARHDWAGLQWPPLLAREKGAASKAEFEALFANRPPDLVAWGKQHYSPSLTGWGEDLLKDYAIYDGFALRRERVETR